MRTLISALLLGAAATGFVAPALAQDGQPDERTGGGWRGEQVERADRAAPATGGIIERRGDRQVRSAPERVEAQSADVPRAAAPRREARGGGDFRPVEGASQVDRRPRADREIVEREGWRGRWENGTPPVVTTPAAAVSVPAPVARQENAPNEDRRWRGGNDRPDWRGADRANAPDSIRDRSLRERRDEAWRRDNQYRGDDRAERDRQWREQQWREQQQRGTGWQRADQHYRSDHRLDHRSRWEGHRRWNNDWRNDRRYDWRDYRRSYASVYRLPAYRAPYGWSYGYRRFSAGIFVSNFLFANTYWINDPYGYRLPPAYGALRWVRYYDDALLVDTRDGYVVDVVYDVFW